MELTKKLKGSHISSDHFERYELASRLAGHGGYPSQLRKSRQRVRCCLTEVQNPSHWHAPRSRRPGRSSLKRLGGVRSIMVSIISEQMQLKRKRPKRLPMSSTARGRFRHNLTSSSMVQSSSVTRQSKRLCCCNLESSILVLAVSEETWCWSSLFLLPSASKSFLLLL